MTIELNREAIARIAALPGVAEAAEAGSALISLWPLTEAMQMDNDAKYAENLQVRLTRAFARVLTGEDVISVGALTHSVRSIDLGLDWN